MTLLSLFVEIQIIGLLILFGLSPLFILTSPTLRRRNGFFAHLDEMSDRSVKALLLVGVAFALGIAGNRLFDDALDGLKIEPGAHATRAYDAWAAAQVVPVAPSLKVAELTAAERSEAARAWLDRHNLFGRVLRGATLSFLLFLLSISIYEAVRLSTNHKPNRRYRSHHFVTALLLIVLFGAAYWSESKSYKKRVFEIVTSLPPPPSR